MNRKKTLLIVDDEVAIQRALKRSFFDYPYIIHTASSALEALDLLENNHIDLVLTDYKMPGMNGVEFLTLVKNKYPGIIRTMISGYIDKDQLMDSLFQFIVASLFPKPWNEDLLHQKIKTYLDLKDKINNLELWDKINSHFISSMFDDSYPETGSLHDFIIMETGIYSGLLHLYNSEYYNGGKGQDLKVIEDHFTTESIRALISKITNSTLLNPFNCFSHTYTDKLIRLYCKIQEQFSTDSLNENIIYPSFINIFRSITFICDKDLFQKMLIEHSFLIHTGTGGYQFNKIIPQIFYYIQSFFTLWNISNSLLTCSDNILNLYGNEGFAGLKNDYKILFIIDFYLEKYGSLPVGEIEQMLLIDTTLLQLQEHQ